MRANAMEDLLKRLIKSTADVEENGLDESTILSIANEASVLLDRSRSKDRQEANRAGSVGPSE